MNVRVNQIWRDRDPRMSNRRLRVVDVIDRRAICQHESRQGPKTKIRLDRLVKHFELVQREPFHLPTDEFCRDVPEEADAAPRHCHHATGDGNLVCCWCGDLFIDEHVSARQHGEYLPKEKR